MDGSTIRRRLARMALPVLSHVAEVARPLIENEHAAVASADADLVVAAAHPMVTRANPRPMAWLVMWPTADRAHRRYAIAIDNSMRPILFLKVSIDPDVDLVPFEAEHRTLQLLEHRPLRSWRTPRSVGLHESSGAISVTMECVPGRRISMTSGQILSRTPLSFRGPGRFGEQAVQAESLSWLMRWTDNPTGSQTFRNTVLSKELQSIHVGLAHGDIQPSNAVSSLGASWLLDWEEADLLAPRGVDEVAILVGRHAWQRRTRSRPTPVQRLLAECSSLRLDAREVGIALIFLADRGNPHALRALNQEWPS
jgi:hypothetical protein